jgi:hypothetical protein
MRRIGLFMLLVVEMFVLAAPTACSSTTEPTRADSVRVQPRDCQDCRTPRPQPRQMPDTGSAR